MNAVWLALIPALSGIIGAFGTILIARWQHKGQQQIFLTQKADEILDERLAESKADREEMKAQLRRADRERQRLSDEQIALKESNAILKSKINEIQLHREQAINRMRHEVNEYNKQNTVLLARNVELETQLALLRQENQALRQQFCDLPGQSVMEPVTLLEHETDEL